MFEECIAQTVQRGAVDYLLYTGQFTPKENRLTFLLYSLLFPVTPNTLTHRYERDIYYVILSL